MNGAETLGPNRTFQDWLTFQMLGSRNNAGAELKRCLWEYRSSQWFRIIMEKARLPFFQPMPAYIIVDNFEEVLRRFPEALKWADTISSNHFHAQISRVIFVVNGPNGTNSLLQYSRYSQYNVLTMQPQTSPDILKVGLVDQKLFSLCQHNVGLYKIVRSRMKYENMSSRDVQDFAAMVLARWVRDLTVPFPYHTHSSWMLLAAADIMKTRKRLIAGLTVLLHGQYELPQYQGQVDRIVEIVSTELAGYDSTLLLDASQADMTVMLSNEHVHRDSLSRAEAKLVAKYLRKVMGNPVDTFCPDDKILSGISPDSPPSTNSASACTSCVE